MTSLPHSWRPFKQYRSKNFHLFVETLIKKSFEYVFSFFLSNLGLKEGLLARPDGSPLFVPIIVATIKGNGSGFMTPITRFIRGSWQPFENELVKPSTTTKLCAFAALIFTLIGYNNDFAYLAIVGLFVSVKVSAIFGEPVDPFKPVEVIFFQILSMISDGRVHAHKD